MKIATLILPVISCAVWGGLAVMGHGLVQGVVARIGHSNPEQTEFYVTLPLVGAIAALIPAIFLSQTRWAFTANLLWSLFALLLVVPYFLFYGGGM